MNEAVAYHFVHRNLRMALTGTLFGESLKWLKVPNTELVPAASLFDSILSRWSGEVFREASIEPGGQLEAHLCNQDYPWVQTHETVVNCRQTLCCIVSVFQV